MIFVFILGICAGWAILAIAFLLWVWLSPEPEDFHDKRKRLIKKGHSVS